MTIPILEGIGNPNNNDHSVITILFDTPEQASAWKNLLNKVPAIVMLCAEMAEQIQGMRHNTSNTCQCDECEEVKPMLARARELGVTP